MTAAGPEPVKPEPDPSQELAAKVAKLALLAVDSREAVKSGIISASEYGLRRGWTEADLIEAWREYVHSLP